MKDQQKDRPGFERELEEADEMVIGVEHEGQPAWLRMMQLGQEAMEVVEDVPLTTCPGLVPEHLSLNEFRGEIAVGSQIAIVCIGTVLI